MRIFKFTLFVFAAGVLTFFANCGGGGGGNEPTDEEKKTELLVGTWSLVSIDLPEVTATEEADWVNFEVTFSATSMNTTGHATGASAVWPSGAWSFSDNLSIIERADDVDMTIVTLTETSLVVTFILPDQDLGGSRVAAIGGEYTFTLEAAE